MNRLLFGIASLALVVAIVSAEDPDYCRTRAVPYTCLTPLFTPEIIKKIIGLKDVNLIAISRMEDAQMTEKLELVDSFCTPYIASTTCGPEDRKAGIWWECSRDISAVTNLINAVQDTMYGNASEWYMPADKIQTYMRYAGLVCNGANGLRDMMKQKTCITDSFAKATEYFRTIQLNKLSDVLASSTFEGKCYQAQTGVFDLMEVIDGGCPPETADAVFRFVAGSFSIVPKYNVDLCPINRTRPAIGLEVPVPTELTVITATEPEWCTGRTSAAKYRCFARNLKADLLTKLNTFDGLNPIMVATLPEDEVNKKLDTVNSFCDFLNSTVGCANEWWQCKADVASVTGLINDLQDLVNGAGHDDWHLQAGWIKRHFVFADYLCKTQDLAKIQTNRDCVAKASTDAKANIDRLSEMLAQKAAFTAEQCARAKTDAQALVNALKASCANNVPEFTKGLIVAAFGMIDGFSSQACDLLAH